VGAAEESPDESEGLGALLLGVVDGVQELAEVVVEPLDFGLVGALALHVRKLGLVHRQLAEFVERDGRGLPQIQRRVLRAGGNRADLVHAGHLVVGQSVVLPAENQAGVGVHVAETVGQLVGRLERKPAVLPGVLVGRRGQSDRVVVLHEVVEGHLVVVRQDVLAGLPGEAVGLAVSAELRRVHQFQVVHAEVLHRSRDGADVTGRLRLHDGDGRRVHEEG